MQSDRNSFVGDASSWIKLTWHSGIKTTLLIKYMVRKQQGTHKVGFEYCSVKMHFSK